MPTIARFHEDRFHRILAATLALFLLTTLSGLAQSAAKKPVEPETKKGT
jgi:hypothetical protein